MYLMTLLIKLNDSKEKNYTCPIEISLTKDSIEIEKRINVNELEINSDTTYSVECTTTEKVRRQGHLVLINNSSHSSYLSTRVESNLTHSFLKGQIRISLYNETIENYKLYCRFITINPEIYCESELVIIAVNSVNNIIRLSIGICVIIFVLVTLKLIIRVLPRFVFIESKNSSIDSKVQTKPPVTENIWVDLSSF